MDGQDAFTCVEHTPNHATQTDNHKSAIDQCTESDFSQLRRNVPFKDITDRVKGWIIRVTNKIWATDG